MSIASAAVLPLAQVQEIVWLHEELFPGGSTYHATVAMDLRGRVDDGALEDSLAMVLGRHAGLRLELLPDGTPAQRIRSECAPRFRRVDLAGGSDPAGCVRQLLRACHEEPFDLDEAPLVRWCLARLADDHRLLIQTEHHLVHDGWSLTLVLRDLFTIYRSLLEGVEPDLPPCRSYAEYVVEQALWDQAVRLREAVAYWSRELAGAVPQRSPLDPANGPRRVAIGQLRQVVAPETASPFRQAAGRSRCTVFMVAAALFGELLRRASGCGDLMLGTAAANRPPGFEETVGMFVNAVPVRVQIDPSLPAVEVVRSVGAALARALRHQSVPIHRLTTGLGLHSATGLDNPLFPVMFSGHTSPLPALDLPGLEVSLLEGFQSGAPKFDLDVVLLPDSRRMLAPRPGPAGLALLWDHDLGVLAPGDIDSLSKQYDGMLSAFGADPSRRVGDLGAGVAM